jgi:xylulokinase
MVSDIFNLPVSVQVSDEGAALGAALQALWMFQHLQGEDTPLQVLLDEHLTLDPVRACIPNEHSVQGYKRFYGQYLRQVKTIKTLYT